MKTLPFGPSRFTLWCIYAMMAVVLGVFAGACADDGGVVSGGGTPGNGENGGNGNGNGSGPPTCDHPTGGDCDGAALLHCVNGKERRIQCDDIFEDGTCRRVALTAWCHVPTGGECAIDGEGSDTRAHNARCDGSNAGCVHEDMSTSGTCVNSIGVCNAIDVKKCIPGGNQYYVHGCLAGQPRVYDCKAMGGTCAQDACRGLKEGAECQTDIQISGRYMRCANDLRCEGETDLSRWGVCVPE